MSIAADRLTAFTRFENAVYRVQDLNRDAHDGTGLYEAEDERDAARVALLRLLDGTSTDLQVDAARDVVAAVSPATRRRVLNYRLGDYGNSAAPVKVPVGEFAALIRTVEGVR